MGCCVGVLQGAGACEMGWVAGEEAKGVGRVGEGQGEGVGGGGVGGGGGGG